MKGKNNIHILVNTCQPFHSFIQFHGWHHHIFFFANVELLRTATICILQQTLPFPLSNTPSTLGNTVTLYSCSTSTNTITIIHIPTSKRWRQKSSKQSMNITAVVVVAVIIIIILGI